jgi:signal transduction histidine kinase
MGADELHIGTDESPASAGGSSAPERQGGSALGLYLAFAALVGFLTTVIWGVTTAGYYWPRWVWFGVGLPAALWASVRYVRRLPVRAERRLAVHGAVLGVLGAADIVIWLFSGAGYFWPIWPISAFALTVGVHALIVYRDRLPPRGREQQLTERVDVLTRTRRGALDVQAAELRRIERDLHDGAQARLVALSMQLGRAEERLEDRPEIAELVRRARIEAGAAIAELRDLARGIAPPVLADRGLAAAIDALGRRSPMPVVVEVYLDRRPTPVVETAAYFVVAEALTNVAKHAGGAPARVNVRQVGERLAIDVADDGPGGADPNGSGLTGLRHRVEALDGMLTVAGAAGEGTTVHAELPCES